MPTDLKPSTAPTASALGGAELIPCTQSGASKALTPAQVADYLATVVLTRLDVDNLRLDANTLATVNSNGSLILTPNGSGGIGLFGSAVGDLGLKRRPTTDQIELVQGDLSGRATVWLKTIYFNQTGSNYASNAVVIKSEGSGVGLSSASPIAWAPGSDADQAKDTGIKRDSAGTLLDTDGGSGFGKHLTGRVVEASTAGVGSPNLLLATESRKLLTNEGATAEAYNTLPSAVAGMEFGFAVQDTDGLRVVAAAGDTIRLAGSVSAAAGFVRSVVVGSALILTAINATEWVALSIVGTWTVDV
jgi:hypothetical protein